MIHCGPAGDGVWLVELDRPRRRNALGVEAYAALADALGGLARRPAVEARAVVLASTGPVFCAGNDLAEFATAWPQPPGGPLERFLVALHALPIPLVAAVQGAAVGIGATLLLHADLVVAEPGAALHYPFVERGITAEGGSSLLLPARLGHQRAMEILLRGRPVPAAEALALGLVSHLAPADRPARDVAFELARAAAARDPAAVVATKRLLRGDGAAMHARFAAEIAAINALLAASRPG